MKFVFGHQNQWLEKLNPEAWAQTPLLFFWVFNFNSTVIRKRHTKRHTLLLFNGRWICSPDNETKNTRLKRKASSFLCVRCVLCFLYFFLSYFFFLSKFSLLFCIWNERHARPLKNCCVKTNGGSESLWLSEEKKRETESFGKYVCAYGKYFLPFAPSQNCMRKLCQNEHA